jgi:tetratricopeptide (TPR) repeat protein
MKNFLYPLFVLLLLSSCTSQKNTDEFINAASGRYLFNADEVLEVHFKNKVLQVKWRGNDDIETLKVAENSFYMKALNEKMLFVEKPEMHIELAPKTEHDDSIYHFRKMKEGEKTPSEYFIAKEYDKSLAAFLEIKKQDSLSPAINEDKMNKLGYEYIRKNNFDLALEVFKINVALYPTNSNVYDSLGEAYLLQKDTLNAEINFKKALSINPENRSSKRLLTKITK